ncbi:hypothetical protein RSOLAG22IIIB_07998 [Rhizoctonia solani]|uniref:Cation/H+ exchanger transmembrane domain-containing protein n=1 Tax=Rhizoctonia solani TaxID=456999 RepID=A0A0K6FR98_9AGAM|nr:hypothetical protein RSOLAG22IIIB_07998 [Rhizoctonia solani]
MTVTMLLVFLSVFFTDMIGVHAIFGALIAGLIIPRDNGFAIALREKIEDLVSILFPPLGYTFLVILVAFLGKFLGCAMPERLMGYNNGEAGAIGMLMSCKGLVELIVLNIGLAAGVLDTKVFSMFVMAVILTFITSPCTTFIYPERVRHHISPNEISGEDSVIKGRRLSTAANNTGCISLMTRLTVVPPCNRGLPNPARSTKSSDEKVDLAGPNTPTISPLGNNTLIISDGTPRVSVDALRLIELTERTSAVIKVIAAEELMRRDTLVSVMDISTESQFPRPYRSFPSTRLARA